MSWLFASLKPAMEKKENICYFKSITSLACFLNRLERLKDSSRIQLFINQSYVPFNNGSIFPVTPCNIRSRKAKPHSEKQNWKIAGDQPQLIQGIRRRDGLGDYLYAN